jgi:hypothetical protein
VIQILRRSGGALGCLLVLHLSLVAGDLACGSHAAASPEAAVAAAPTAAAGAHGAHHQHGGAAASDAGQGHDDGDEPCKTPSRDRCCEALASCTVQIAFAAAAEMAAAPGSDSALLDNEAAPVSRAAAPEPPPPKA